MREFLAILWLSCMRFNALTCDSSAGREAAAAVCIGG